MYLTTVRNIEIKGKKRIVILNFQPIYIGLRKISRCCFYGDINIGDSISVSLLQGVIPKAVKV